MEKETINTYKIKEKFEKIFLNEKYKDNTEYLISTLLDIPSIDLKDSLIIAKTDSPKGYLIMF